MQDLLLGKLKTLLIRDKYLDKAELEKADQIARQTERDFPDILVNHHFLDKDKTLQALSEVYAVEARDLSRGKIAKNIVSMIPKAMAMRHMVVAIMCQEDALTVSMADPTDIIALDDIKTATGLNVKPVVSLRSDVEKLIQNAYHESSEKIIEDIISTEMTGIDSRLDIISEGEDEQNINDLFQQAQEAPIVKITQLIFLHAIRDRASDVLIEPLERGLRIRYRIDGLLHEVRRMPKNIHASIISRIKIISHLNIAEHRRPQDGRFRLRYRGRDVDFRVSIVPSNYGEKVAVRVLDKEAAKLDIKILGFEKEALDMIIHYARQPHGMILVCGPTGSGKTTTLYSVLKLIDDPAMSLVTVEDPIEYEMYGISQVAINTDVDLTFTKSLRSILRQDPDVILIGEIRDEETLDVAVKAALTGHLVLSTLHTTSAVGSVTRLVNMGVEPFLICSSVLMVGAQRLARKLCSRCKKKKTISPDVCKKYGIPLKDKSGNEIYEADGCDECFRTGYKGRVCLIEILCLDSSIKDLLMSGAHEVQILKKARENGMKTLRDNGISKMLQGLTTLDEVLRLTVGEQDIDV